MEFTAVSMSTRMWMQLDVWHGLVTDFRKYLSFAPRRASQGSCGPPKLLSLRSSLPCMQKNWGMWQVVGFSSCSSCML